VAFGLHVKAVSGFGRGRSGLLYRLVGLPLTLTLSPEGRGDWFGVGVWLVRSVATALALGSWRAGAGRSVSLLQQGASVELSEWLLGGCRAGTPERTAVRDGVRFGGQRRRRRSATRDFYYWQNAERQIVNFSEAPLYRRLWLLSSAVRG